MSIADANVRAIDEFAPFKTDGHHLTRLGQILSHPAEKVIGSKFVFIPQEDNMVNSAIFCAIIVGIVFGGSSRPRLVISIPDKSLLAWSDSVGISGAWTYTDDFGRSGYLSIHGDIYLMID